MADEEVLKQVLAQNERLIGVIETTIKRLLPEPQPLIPDDFDDYDVEVDSADWTDAYMPDYLMTSRPDVLTIVDDSLTLEEEIGLGDE